MDEVQVFVKEPPNQWGDGACGYRVGLTDEQQTAIMDLLIGWGFDPATIQPIT